ncbi:hypothetical protein M8J76_014042 [Diaphorina citri]|nr:hypothetical protein M8J76_014042 [Diaphorina citri]
METGRTLFLRKLWYARAIGCHTLSSDRESDDQCPKDSGTIALLDGDKESKILIYVRGSVVKCCSKLLRNLDISFDLDYDKRLDSNSPTSVKVCIQT